MNYMLNGLALWVQKMPVEINITQPKSGYPAIHLRAQASPIRAPGSKPKPRLSHAMHDHVVLLLLGPVSGVAVSTKNICSYQSRAQSYTTFRHLFRRIPQSIDRVTGLNKRLKVL